MIVIPWLSFVDMAMRGWFLLLFFSLFLSRLQHLASRQTEAPASVNVSVCCSLAPLRLLVG